MLDTFLINVTGVNVPEDLPLFNTQTKTAITWKQCFYASDRQYREIGYFPIVDVFRVKDKTGNWQTNRITIQASAPKLLHNNSYFGIFETAYDAVVRAIVKVLDFLGIRVTTADIDRAVLRAITFCFNFFFPKNYPYPDEYLKLMGFLDIGRRFSKVKNTRYVEETDGYSGKMYNGQTSWGLYAKANQIINDPKTEAEFEIIAKMKKGQLPDNILRIELNYQNQTSLKQHLNSRLGDKGKAPRTLREVFNDDLAKSVLLDAFDELAKEVNVVPLELPLVPVDQTVKKLLAQGLNEYQIEAVIGRALILQQVGSLKYKGILSKYRNPAYRGRLEKQHQEVLKANPLPPGTLTKIFTEARRQLEAFEILTPDSDLMRFLSPIAQRHVAPVAV